MEKILITGGLGMIGSTIARKYVNEGADVMILDGLLEPFGGNFFNIHDIKDNVKVNIADIRDKECMKWIVKGKDVIYNLAGQVAHNDSMSDPFKDADINYIGHLNVLEYVRLYNPDAVIVHPGSRMQYGLIEYNPVGEDHPLHPRSPYALNKCATENMYLYYYNIHSINCILFRIANPYGPRSQMKHSKYSMVNWFIRQAMEDKPISIFGEGSQIRDYIYVEDLADAMISAASQRMCWGQIYNIGSGVGTRMIDMANAVVDVVGSGSIESVPWPSDYINIETGDFIANTDKIHKDTGWEARTSLDAGIQQTYSYYKTNREFYW
jgi:UDP-glucose 4-epimerase